MAAMEHIFRVVYGGGFSGGIRGGILGGGPKSTSLAGSIGSALGVGALWGGAFTALNKGIKELAEYVQKYMPVSTKMLEHIHKGIEMIIRPLDMMLTTAMMPIVYILRPIGLFFNTMMRPYIQKAMEAMRAGAMGIKAGTAEGALQAAASFNLGFQYLMKPFTDALMLGFVAVENMVIDTFQFIGNAIIDTLDPTGLMNGIQAGMNMGIDTLQKGATDTFTGVSNTVSTYLDATLIAVKAWGKQFQEEISNGLGGTLGGTEKRNSRGSINDAFSNYDPFRDTVFIDGQGYCIANGGKGP